MKTELADRTLWFDGDMTIKPSQLYDVMAEIDPAQVGHICVEQMTDEIEQYNSLASSDERIHTKHELGNISTKWMIPEEFRNLDVLKHVTQVLEQHRVQEEFTEEEYLDRYERLLVEYKEFKRLKLMPLLRTLIYVINTFERDSVVWGPGRGSSVSSYLLYLIGVHDVDSVFFELEISDFMKHI